METGGSSGFARHPDQSRGERPCLKNKVKVKTPDVNFWPAHKYVYMFIGIHAHTHIPHIHTCVVDARVLVCFHLLSRKNKLVNADKWMGPGRIPTNLGMLVATRLGAGMQGNTEEGRFTLH